MIEFKKRDFKLSLGVNSEATILLHSNDLFEYEISKDIKNNRLRSILNFFIKLFSGTSIKFHLSNVVCDLDFVNHIENFKFNNILQILDEYEQLVKIYSLYKNKDLSSQDNSFYSLFLLNSNLYSDSIDTWINSKIENDYNLRVGDKLIINRIHTFNFKNLPFNLIEKIELKNALTEKELLNKKIQLNRKTVKVTFEKMQK